MDGCPAAVQWGTVSQTLHSSVAFEIIALLQVVTVCIISVIFWTVFLTSPYPLQVGFGGTAVGRVVTATASVRNKTVISISDYCAASGSTPQRILMTLCTIFSMLSISAALFGEDRLRMWRLVLGPEHTPFFEEKARVLCMFILGQLGMFFTGNMEVRDGPRYFQTFFMVMHTAGAVGFVTLSPVSAWWFNDCRRDWFLWMLLGSTGCFCAFSVLSFFTDAYMFPCKPRAMTRIYTNPRVRPGAFDIEIRVSGLKQLEAAGAEFFAEDIQVGAALLQNGSPRWELQSLTTDPVFHQMWLNHTLTTGEPFPADPMTVKMKVRQTAPPPHRGAWSAVFVTLEFLAMLLSSVSCILLTFSFTRLNYGHNFPSIVQSTC